MIFWSKNKRRFKLPRFPETVAPTFKALCENIDSSQIEELRQAVDECLRDARKKKEKNENLDLEGAEELTRRCHYLLDNYEKYSEQQRAQVVGAIRYFAIAEDPFDDETFATGFHDDKRVMNYVLEDLGLEEQYIDLDY